MKTTVTVLTGLTLGFVMGILLTPISGEELRAKLFGPTVSDDENSDLHTFSINELVSPDSSSLESIKEKIRHGA